MASISHKNQLHFGDNLDILRNDIPDNSVDLIYLDPPFNSNQTYNILFHNPMGDRSQAQIEAFDDTWHWNTTTEESYDAVLHCGNTAAAAMLRAMRDFLKESDMMAYLTMMAIRLLELHRVLKSTGSLYLHCDPTASHYLKILLDAVFGIGNFRNSISWKRSGRRSSITKVFRRAHDEILFYKKTDTATFFLQYQAFDTTLLRKYTGQDERGRFQLVPLMASGKVLHGETGKLWRGFDPNTRGKAGMHWLTTHDKLEHYVAQGLVAFPRRPNGTPRLKYYLEQNKGVPLSDFWDDIDLINAMGNESLGYQTQKPLALLERIINASSSEESVVLDPFCGCGTAIHAAEKLGRAWIGIDVTHLAISLIEKRLNDAFPGIAYEVHGTPKDLEGAKALAVRDKYQFQWWAVSLVNAVPYGGKKKGADTGIDGIIYFKPQGKHTEKAIVSVKGGAHVSVAMIRDLAHVVDREQAKIGVFVTLAPPTGPMRTEATKAGWYETTYHGKLPKIQILTIADLFAGDKPRIPFIDPSTFRRARPEERQEQERLFA